MPMQYVRKQLTNTEFGKYNDIILSRVLNASKTFDVLRVSLMDSYFKFL